MCKVHPSHVQSVSISCAKCIHIREHPDNKWWLVVTIDKLRFGSIEVSKLSSRIASQRPDCSGSVWAHCIAWQQIWTFEHVVHLLNKLAQSRRAVQQTVSASFNLLQSPNFISFEVKLFSQSNYFPTNLAGICRHQSFFAQINFIHLSGAMLLSKCMEKVIHYWEVKV